MPKNRLIINETTCKGCSLCTVVCPKGILKLNKDLVNTRGYNPIRCIDPEKCIGCAMCAQMCPDSVIEVRRIL